jgi:hypothetical protein
MTDATTSGRRARRRGHAIVACGCDQGDQMSLRKNGLKCGPTRFLSKLMHNLSRVQKYAYDLPHHKFSNTCPKKQLPNGQKFAQSGPPFCYYVTALYIFVPKILYVGM